MATLKGQNFRIIYGSGVIGMATNCTVTLGTSTESASTKDVVGIAAKPTVISKNWQVQVESLYVQDISAFLGAIKTGYLFDLIWDETSTSDNVQPQSATFARHGKAYLTDATINFNDRENSTKSLQFIGSGEIEAVTGEPTISVPTQAYTKGQFVRLYLGSDNSAVPSKVIAAAKQLSIHVTATVENSSTKDTDGDWVVNEVTEVSYDITTNALMRSGETITSTVLGQDIASLEEIYETSLPVRFQIANVSGANQRTKGTVIISGSVILTQLVMNGPNRQNADYTATLTGVGEFGFS